MDLDKYSDDELIRKYTVKVNNRSFVPRKVLDFIGHRHAEMAGRKPGDPGTKENPIFKNGHAYIFSSTDRLIMWEDYDGLVPIGDGVTVNINPATMEAFTLTRDMKPTTDQKKMIQNVRNLKITFSEDCPRSSDSQLQRFRNNGRLRASRKNRNK